MTVFITKESAFSIFFADFNLELETAFLVKVAISHKAFVSKDETKDGTKGEVADISEVTMRVLGAIVSLPNDTKAQIIAKPSFSEQ